MTGSGPWKRAHISISGTDGPGRVIAWMRFLLLQPGSGTGLIARLRSGSGRGSAGESVSWDRFVRRCWPISNPSFRRVRPSRPVSICRAYRAFRWIRRPSRAPIRFSCMPDASMGNGRPNTCWRLSGAIWKTSPRRNWCSCARLPMRNVSVPASLGRSPATSDWSPGRTTSSLGSTALRP